MPSAREQALRLIKFRPRSETELRNRLAQKRFSAEDTERVLSEFRQKGWVDDAKFARLFVAQKMSSRPVGRRGLLAQLRSRGIQGDLAEQAVQTEMGERPEAELVRQAAEERMARMKGLERDVMERRLFGFLSRRGFPSSLIYETIRALREQR